jgi:hypothetical protein
MAKRDGQKVKGCRKCGRNKKKSANKGNAISLFVRNKISAREYFSLSGQTFKGV